MVKIKIQDEEVLKGFFTIMCSVKQLLKVCIESFGLRAACAMRICDTAVPVAGAVDNHCHSIIADVF